MDSEMISPGRGGFQATRKDRRSRLDPLVWIAIALTLLALLAFAFTGLVAPSKAKSGGGLYYFEAGLRLTGVQNSQVLDTRFSMNSDASAWVEGSTGNKFKRNTMTDNGDGGFRLVASNHNRIAGNHIARASDSGIMMEELSSHNRLVRNEVTLAGEGIKVEGGSHNRAFRNTTSWNGGAGIEVAEDSLHTRINENQAHHNGGDGIFIEGTGTQVNGNHAGCNGGFGIKSPVLSAGGENWAGGNGDNLGCDGVVCRLSLSCGTE
jgi:parallel beta-helix repeat protein